MVGKTASAGVEIVMTLLEGINHILEVDDVHAGLFTQSLHIIGKARLVNIYTLVGSECGKNSRLEFLVLLDFNVPLKSVRRIVRCADNLNVRSLNKLLSAEFGLRKKLVTLNPYSLA